ncbi:MAG: hypothetical protein IJ306_01175 [Oscillospiraceae bacterium]|nr:hypothetical protein [Oscillospiraceae bacterium]
MQEYPTLNAIPTTRQSVETFKGYNHNMRIGNGEFFDMENLCSDFYPVLSPRGKRGILARPEAARGMISKDEFCYVDGTEFVMGDQRIEMGFDDREKELISMGAFVIIMPDKKYINTADITDFGDIESAFTSSGETEFYICKADGEGYGEMTVSDTAPENPNNLEVWLDTSAVPHTLKQYSTASGTWVSVATTYVRIAAEGIGKNFEVYDGVAISGITAAPDLNGTAVIQAKGDDYIVITGLLDEEQSQFDSIEVKRAMPAMDFITEANNRLWGCRYGTAENGDTVNEIYACKLGDFRNWNCFMGISTDSYAASCGTDGKFTGAVTHRGYPIFFKEGCLHKVYGNYPSNFQIQVTECRGVQEGCHRSLAIVNEVLYYKSRSAVCAYDGSLPVEMSTALGEERYKNAAGGAHGNKYYISMLDSRDEPSLFVYDTAKGMWHREDATKARQFCEHREEMLFIDDADGSIRTVFGSGNEQEESLEWMAETGNLGMDMAEKKYISRIIIRMSLDIGSVLSIDAQYDSSGKWEHVTDIKGTSLRSFSIPVRPKRCDHFRLRFSGKGNAKIFSMVKTYEQGSDY